EGAPRLRWEAESRCGFVLLSEHATFDWRLGSGLRRREADLDAEGSFDGADVVKGQGCQLGFEPLLADGGDLVGHRLARLAIQIDGSFTGVNTGYVACDRNDLNAVEIAVGRVIADDDRGRGLLDLTAERRIEIDPPNFTAKHGVL